VNVKPDPGAVSQLGLELKQSPTLTELRLPSRLGFGTGSVLGCAGMIVAMMGAAVAAAVGFGSRERLGALGIAALVVVALLFGLAQAVRGYRYGVKLSITPDRLIAKRHWITGEPPLELFLGQVQLDETPRAIVVSKGRRKLKMGSALKPDERHAVAGFLRSVIDTHLHPAVEGAIAAPEVDPELAPAASEPSSEGGAPAPFPITSPKCDQTSWGPSMLALCRRLQGYDLDDVHLAPRIPDAVIALAAQSYLNLQDDEVLLAIVGVKKQGSPVLGCALTTERIYWPGPRRHHSVPGPRRCHSLEYASLPERIQTRRFGSTVSLGHGRVLNLQGNKPLRGALVNFLEAVRALARGEGTVFAVTEPERAAATSAWPRVAAASQDTKAMQGEIHAFEGRAHVASRAVVTTMIAVACFAVFVAMVAGGAHAITPDGEQLLKWGANFGPSIVFDHQFWRLFTAVFLHIGIFHLVMNMYCLLTAGPVVERFFGHLGFALLYALSGLGGSVASVWAHPTYISVGASGAIFGIFGGLLGFLAIRHRDVPVAVLKPMRAGAIAFVGYNMFFSLSVPGIDMAAHLGGLVTGFVCGLLMTLVATARTQAALGLAAALRRAAVAAVLAIAVAGLGQKAIDAARAVILADPKMGPLINSQLSAAPAFNAFFTAANPILLELDRIAVNIDTVSADLNRGTLPEARATQTLSRLKAESKSLVERIGAIPAQNAELQAMRSHIAAAQTHQARVLEAIDRVVTGGGESQIEGPAGVKASAQAYIKECNDLGNLRDAYIKAHGLQFVPAKAGR
jgi:rhomboid protease GluP